MSGLALHLYHIIRSDTHKNYCPRAVEVCLRHRDARKTAAVYYNYCDDDDDDNDNNDDSTISYNTTNASVLRNI